MKESTANNILQRLKILGKESGGLLILDQELAQRVFTQATTAQEGKQANQK